MPRYVLLPLLALLFCLTACDPEPPAEAELRIHLKGRYCSTGRLLVLGDSTYFHERLSLGPLKVGVWRESCQGRYALRQDSLGQWYLRFFADEWPQGLESCAGEWLIWAVETGYRYDVEQDIGLPDPLTQGRLGKGNCGI